MQENELNQANMTNSMMQEWIKERRSEKRWKNIRFFVVFFFILFILMLIFKGKEVAPLASESYVALIRLDGMIEAGRGFSAEEVLPVLKEAFEDSRAKGVILQINSGGGTPVQASIIHDAILQLKKKHHKKVVVVGEDLLASGAYFVAVSADKIFVNPNTITGSIGVIMKGFGFPDLIQKIGVTRRVYTAGANKDRLDPFLPQNKEDVEKIQTVIAEVHDNFKQVVLEGRKGKLHADENTLFSGDFWSGVSALKLGLVDGLGNLDEVMQSEFHVENYREFSSSQNVLKNLVGQIGTTLDMALGRESVGVEAKI